MVPQHRYDLLLCALALISCQFAYPTQVLLYGSPCRTEENTELCWLRSTFVPFPGAFSTFFPFVMEVASFVIVWLKYGNTSSNENVLLYWCSEEESFHWKVQQQAPTLLQCPWARCCCSVASLTKSMVFSHSEDISPFGYTCFRFHYNGWPLTIFLDFLSLS